ncbi:hypothetical protein [Frankia sp. Cppng1_Ct_nod]|uniref:hypothetical protein n=1 Tax=Frankia sp. Cppng1_Ct_nod TaxID=2897162 RepID=UPI0010413C73|nr:hypothetical protein [Frankia sp. Cppng1_Ct_nod]
MDIAAQIFTLAGVVLGAAGSLVGTTLVERSRYRRDIAIRWDTRKYDTYCDYIGYIVHMARITGQIAGMRGWDPIAAMAASEELAIADLDKAELSRTISFERVVLLGDQRCIEAGNSLNGAVWAMEWIARGKTPGSPSIWKEATGRLVRELTAFHEVARVSLNVPLARLERRIELPIPSPDHDAEPRTGAL